MANTKTKRATHVEAIQPFAGDSEDGVPFVVQRGKIFPADDEIVKRYPENFRELGDSRQRPAVEKATAAPGEKRGE